MKKLKTNAELRQTARGALSGRYTEIIPYVLYYVVMTSLITGWTSILPYDDTLFMLLIFTLADIVSTAILSIFEFGFLKIFMQICCKKFLKNGLLFSGFSNNPARTVKVSVLLSLLLCICMLPHHLYYYMNSELSISLYFGLAIAGMLVYYIIALSFSQCMYLLVDFPTLEFSEIVMLSRKLMKGQKLRYLGLQISFLPLYLLGFLTCGVGLLWIMPYHYSANTCFYLNLVASKE